MTRKIDRRQFAAGIVAAGLAGHAAASSPIAVVPQQLHLKPNGWMPNNTLPVLLYRNAIPVRGDVASTMEKLFAANGWPPQWRNGVYDFHHYHSDRARGARFCGWMGEVDVGW